MVNKETKDDTDTTDKRKGWLQQTRVTEKVFGTKPDASDAIKCDAYIIGLGGNDGLRHLKDIGSEADIDSTDYTKNANTFVGQYDVLIRKLRNIHPNCKIFICTYAVPMIKSNSMVPYHEAIRSIASSGRYKNLYLIDMNKYAEDYFIKDIDYIGNDVHQTAVGYLKKAYLISTYIDWIIRKNMNSFNNVKFIDANNAIHY